MQDNLTQRLLCRQISVVQQSGTQGPTADGHDFVYLLGSAQPQRAAALAQEQRAAPVQVITAAEV